MTLVAKLAFLESVQYRYIQYTRLAGIACTVVVTIMHKTGIQQHYGTDDGDDSSNSSG